MKIGHTTMPAVAPLTADQIALIKRTICRGASDDELRMFLHQVARTQLDPMSRQIYAIKRWDNELRREVMSIQVSIDGFRLVAERTGKYAGQTGPHWCGADGEWVDCWTASEPPAAARVMVLRRDFKEPMIGTASFNSFVQRRRDGSPTRMWASMPDVMLAKCAEAQALRRAFPHELSGLYTGDEMGQATIADDAPAAPQDGPAGSAPRAPAPPADNVMRAANDNAANGDDAVAYERLQQWDTALSEAAQLGMEELRRVWDGVPGDARPVLKAALDRRYKVIAEGVDFARSHPAGPAR